MVRRTIHTIQEGASYGLWTTMYSVQGVIERWMCRCECGNEGLVRKSHLYNRESNSCGCVGRAKIKERNTTHGMSGTKEYSTWTSIKNRCYNVEGQDYKDYGGAGITVSDEWINSFENFLSDMGLSPVDNKKWSIGRLDNSIGYCKENCRWETDEQQARNHTILSNNTSGKTGVSKRVRKGRISFVAAWMGLEGKKHTREFSAGKYGEQGARNLAESARDKAINDLNKLGAGYSDKHGL